MSESPVVCIVIPVYKPTLTYEERISLMQCMRILGNYPVFLAAPTGLDVSAITREFPALQVQTFAASFFADIQAYNQLMLSETFYRAFVGFEYLLIHQLDAFVFADELADWCRRGYDYVGAPWLRDIDFKNSTDELIFNAKKQIAIWLDLKKPDGVTPREIIGQNSVGNGGLSLRRVPAFLAVLTDNALKQKLITYTQNSTYQYNEDVFWGVEVNRYWPRLRVPDFRTALQFAVEFFPERAINTYNQGRLPFGCHAWDIHGTDYWRAVFAGYGYDI
jgi:Protein of unknown function (DUF5672)